MAVATLGQRLPDCKAIWGVTPASVVHPGPLGSSLSSVSTSLLASEDGTSVPALCHVSRTPPAVAAAAPRKVIRIAPLPSESLTIGFGARAPAIALTAVADRYGVSGFSGDIHSGGTDWGSSGQGGPLRKVASSPVDIPGRAARTRTSDSRSGCLRMGAASVAFAEEARVGPPAADLGSWAARKIVYPLPLRDCSGQAGPQASPGTPHHGYGFLPEQVAAALAAKKPYQGEAGTGHALLQGRQALRAAAATPGKNPHPPCVRFAAAVRARSPVRPGTAAPNQAARAQTQHRRGPPPARAPAAATTGDAAALQRWRTGFKRAWIKEELHALHGRFPDGPGYEDDWDEALAWLRTCGPGVALHFADPNPDLNPDPHDGPDPLAGIDGVLLGEDGLGPADALEGEAPSPLAWFGSLARGVPPSVNGHNAASGFGAGTWVASDRSSSSGMGGHIPKTLVGRAQELTRQQRQIEAQVAAAWDRLGAAAC